MTIHHFTGGYVLKYFLAGTSNFTDTTLVAWQLVLAKK